MQKKHSDTSSVHYNSGFFITTNVYPDFGGGRDGEAIKKRLSVFETVALRYKDPGISGENVFVVIGFRALLTIFNDNDFFGWHRNC